MKNWGGVYMIPERISFWYEFIPVLTYRSVFVYMIPVKNIIPVQLIPVWVHPGSCIRIEILITVWKVIPVSCKRYIDSHSGTSCQVVVDWDYWRMRCISNSSTSLDAIIVLVHASSLCQYLCRPCKRGMKLTTRTRMKLVPVSCKHPLTLICFLQ